MKKIKAVIISAVLVLAMLTLTACGGSGSSASASSAAKKEVTGKTIKIKMATVLVPDGWMAITPSGGSDKTDDFTETQAINIYKGAKDATDFRHCLVQVQCVNTKTSYDSFKSGAGLDDAKDLGELKAGAYTFKTFSGKSGSYEYTCGLAESGNNTISFMALTKLDSETLDVNDAEVLAILASIAPSK